MHRLGRRPAVKPIERVRCVRRSCDPRQRGRHSSPGPSQRAHRQASQSRSSGCPRQDPVGAPPQQSPIARTGLSATRAGPWRRRTAAALPRDRERNTACLRRPRCCPHPDGQGLGTKSGSDAGARFASISIRRSGPSALPAASNSASLKTRSPPSVLAPTNSEYQRRSSPSMAFSLDRSAANGSPRLPGIGDVPCVARSS